MSDSTQTAACVVCGQNVPAEGQECSFCGATGAWQDLIQAARLRKDRFEEWAKEQRIGSGPAEAIADNCRKQHESLVQMAKQRRPLPQDVPLMPADACWDCRSPISKKDHHCPRCGVPVNNDLAQSLRYLTYTSYVIKSHCDAGRLPLVQAHACMNEAKSRILGRRTRLEKDRAVQAAVVEKSSAPAAGSPAPRQTSTSASSGAMPPQIPAGVGRAAAAAPVARPKVQRPPLWEIILDPRTIQWMLGFGGVLLVLGLVIWLATLGVFKNPVVVAVSLGIGNTAVLAGGWAMIRFSRYQTAGRAITLLACLVMPLNLWFYNSYDLITVGGNLWAAAMVCCVIYLASALVLRDHLFIYVLNGGIAMTGLLMLADAGKFWEIASPAALLVILGLISIHVERAFPEIEGPFSRRRFGMACFRSGQVLLASGLLLVLGIKSSAIGSGSRFSSNSINTGATRNSAIRDRPLSPSLGANISRGLGPAGILCLLLFRHRGPPVGRICLCGRVHAALGRNAGDRTGHAAGNVGSGHHRVGLDGPGRQSASARAGPMAEAAFAQAENRTILPPRLYRSCGPASRWACSSAPCPCCSGCCCTCGPRTDR